MVEISLYEMCALITVACLVVITIYLVKLLKKATQTLTGVEDTNKKVNEIVGHLNGAVSLVNPLLNTMKDAKRMLEQLRNVLNGLKGKKVDDDNIDESKKVQKIAKKKQTRK